FPEEPEPGFVAAGQALQAGERDALFRLEVFHVHDEQSASGRLGFWNKGVSPWARCGGELQVQTRRQVGIRLMNGRARPLGAPFCTEADGAARHPYRFCIYEIVSSVFGRAGAKAEGKS